MSQVISDPFLVPTILILVSGSGREFSVLGHVFLQKGFMDIPDMSMDAPDVSMDVMASSKDVSIDVPASCRGPQIFSCF
jgi:hypothetical protein